MTATLVVLAASLCGGGPSAQAPGRDVPGWVWVSNEGRYGWGTVRGGYFRPAEPGFPHSSVGVALENGVNVEGLRPEMKGTVTTNDQTYRPERCGPDPDPEPEPESINALPLILGCLAALCGLVGLILLIARPRGR